MKLSFADYIKDHLFIVMAAIAAVLLVILVLLLRSIHAEKKVIEEEHLVRDLNKRVFVDPLTSVRNKGAFDEYVQQMQDKLVEHRQYIAKYGADLPEVTEWKWK